MGHLLQHINRKRKDQLKHSADKPQMVTLCMKINKVCLTGEQLRGGPEK